MAVRYDRFGGVELGKSQLELAEWHEDARGWFAVSLARRHSPDCILVDMNTPAENERVLDALLADATIRTLPMVLVTNDEDLFEKYRPFVSARLKREFRKSTLLSSIHNAVSQPSIPGMAMSRRTSA